LTLMSPNSSASPDLSRAAQAAHEADACFSRADYSAADALYTEALALYEVHLRTNRLEVAHCRLGLGWVRNTQGRFQEARALVEQALTLFGSDPLGKATAHYVLGEIISNQGDLPGSIEHLRHSYEIRHKALGPAHPDTLNSLSLLALLQFLVGEVQSAQRLMTKACHLADTWSGELPAAIAKVYHRQGRMWLHDPDRCELARRMLERALAIFERSEGPDHPDVGLALNNLAILLSDQKEWAAARPLLERSLAIHERAYGTRSPFNLFMLGNLADTEKHLGNLDAAYRYAARTVCVAVRSMGPRSSYALSGLHKLVAVQVARDRAGDKQAMQHAMPFNQCLVALEVAIGKRDPQKEVTPGARLAPEKAAQRLEKLVARLEIELDRPPRSAAEQAIYEQGLATAASLVTAGNTAMQRGDITLAHNLYQQALTVQEALPDCEPIHHIPILEKLIETSDALGHPTAVLPLRERILDIQTAALGEDHPSTLLAMAQLQQRIAYEYGKEAAQPMLARLQALREGVLGPDDPFSRMARGMLGLNRGLEEVQTEPAALRGPSRSERYEAAMIEALNRPAAILAGLDEIDWPHLHHAYGSAGDTPRHLRLLLSADEVVRKDAWLALYGSIWHQGTVYEASAFAVPFLIAMLDQDGPPGRGEVLSFLADLAAGSSYLDVHARPNRHNLDWKKLLLKTGQGDLETETRKELAVVEQVNRAVGEGVPRYLALLDNPDSELQLQALVVLARLRGRTAEIVPPLLARLGQFSDPGLRAVALSALRALMDHGPEAIAFFTQELSTTGADPRVTFQAAAGVIERAGQAAPQSAVDALLGTWSEARRLADENFKALPEFYQVENYHLHILANLDPERGQAALTRILSGPLPVDEVLDLAGLLLDLLFNAGQIQEKSTAESLKTPEAGRVRTIDYWSPPPQPARDPVGLNPAQRSALNLLLDLPAFWASEHNLLALYGLPERREELRQFITCR
jgi:tetratricopeptide (TPR) repeat protein